MKGMLWYAINCMDRECGKKRKFKCFARRLLAMAINVKCPKCGSENVQLSNEKSGHGCLWIILFGWFYIFWVMIKWCIGFLVFILYDWWMFIVKKSGGKGHIWKCRKWFSANRKTYYCHDCGHNFRI